MKIKQTDVVAEYLHEVDLRLSGLPVLQRRELLADLAAHIATERTERNIQTEGELIEVLERLGSPEVVAAAAYEEAGTKPPRPAPAARRNWIPIAIAAGVVVVVLVLCGGFVLFGAFRNAGPQPVQVRPVPAAATPTISTGP
jgi:uncharacterized membrane protein